MTCDIQTLQYSLLFGSCVRLLSETVSYLSLKLCLHTQCQHSTRICFPRGNPLILPNKNSCQTSPKDNWGNYFDIAQRLSFHKSCCWVQEMKGIVDETLCMILFTLHYKVQAQGISTYVCSLKIIGPFNGCWHLFTAQSIFLVPKQIWQVPTFEPLLAAAFKKSGMIRVEVISIIFDNEGGECPKNKPKPQKSPFWTKKSWKTHRDFHPFSTTPWNTGEVTQEWRELRLAKTTESTLPGASEGTGQSVVKVAGNREKIVSRWDAPRVFP